MKINVVIDYELKSMCYLKILLTLIRCYIRSESLLRLARRGALLEKQYDILLRLECLKLPNCIKRELSLLLNKIFSEIQYLWFGEQITMGIGLTDYLQIRHWNLDGSLNRRSLAKAIMETRNLSKSRCFILACDHCLEYEARFYWDQMTEHERNTVIKSPAPTFSWIVMPSIFSRVIVNRHLKKDIALGPKSWYDDDIYALSYELKTLMPEEQIKLVMRVAKIRTVQTNVMRLCLSFLDENQQMEVCNENPYGVLRSLLTWPYHDQFIPVANFLWNNLKESEFCSLISSLISDIERWPEPEHVQLLKDFWEASPEPLKIYVTYKETYGRLIDLFDSVARMTRNSVLFPVWGDMLHRFEMSEE